MSFGIARNGIRLSSWRKAASNSGFISVARIPSRSMVWSVAASSSSPRLPQHSTVDPQLRWTRLQSSPRLPMQSPLGLPLQGSDLQWRARSGRGDRGGRKDKGKKSQARHIDTIDKLGQGYPSSPVDVIFDYDAVAQSMQACVKHLERYIGGLLVGRVSPELIADTEITLYHCPTPLKAVGQITVQGPQKLLLTVHRDLTEIHKEVQRLNLDAGIQVEPAGISFTFPKVTRERREELAKLVRQKGEQCRECIRNGHRKGMNELKKVKASEDDTHIIKEDLQSMQSTAIAFSRSLVEAKLQEIEEA